MYVVIVQIHVRPEFVDDFLAATRASHLGTRGEPGNARFDLLARLDDPQRFVLYEAYVDEASFKVHQQTPHYFSWRETVAPMMAEPRTSQKLVSRFPEPWS